MCSCVCVCFVGLKKTAAITTKQCFTVTSVEETNCAKVAGSRFTWYILLYIYIYIPVYIPVYNNLSWDFFFVILSSAQRERGRERINYIQIVFILRGEYCAHKLSKMNIYIPVYRYIYAQSCA